jgi:HPt (histidine-containing phosphotransfer) domain-containing protein
MLFDRGINNESRETDPLTPAPSGLASLTGDPLDMEMLNAFEELQVDDGSDLIVELIDLYLQDLPQRVTKIREAAIATEWVLLKRVAHALKGSSGSLGIRHVAEICQKLEWLDRHDSPGTVAALLRLLEYEAAMATASLAAVRQRRIR